MSEQRPPAHHGDGDEPVGRSLRELPGVRASASFTDGVLARTATRARARRILLPALIGAAAAGIVLAVGAQLTGGGRQSDPDLAAIRHELTELRREQRELAQQLERLRTEDPETGLPVIYVGQSAGVDLVLDLARFETAARPGGGPEHRGIKTGFEPEGER